MSITLRSRVRARHLVAGALWAVAGLTLAVAGCSSGGSEDATGDAGEKRSSITSYEDVRLATIQIVAQGTLRDPEIGLADASGAGSGFIISADGLAVTNNHVVTGAATLEVFIGGDRTRSYNATIIGVSECNDLALIDIAESEPLPFLDWSTETVTAGLEVWAAGFPLGDPEFTLTRGIITKARAGGDLTGTSSIDHTIEHDANINPGSSGGPLVREDGRVIAINYAGGQVAITPQFYSIAADLAKPVVDRLAQGDFESLGVNGWAIADDTAGITGIWVAGVSPGSPAARVKLQPGDIITSLNGLPMGTDGTFRDYCDVIRTSGDRPIAAEVLRYDTGEVLAGEINGTEALAVSFTLGGFVEEDLPPTQSSGAGSYDYVSVEDDTGRMTVDLPRQWSEIDTLPVDQDGQPMPGISASADLGAFYSGFDEPGVALVAFEGGSIEQALNEFGAADPGCNLAAEEDYDDGLYAGVVRYWDGCGSGSSVVVLLVAAPADGSMLIIVLGQAQTEQDLQALDRVLGTFIVEPPR